MQHFPAYPLITVDPYFSVWSCSDRLEETYTRHWTGRPAPIYLSVKLDNTEYKIASFDKNNVNRQTVNRLPQTDVSITALSTLYTFENESVKLTLDFTTPLLPDRLDILCRPVSYIAYHLEQKDPKIKNISLIFGISSECCVDSVEEAVEIRKTDFSLSCGNTKQAPLSYVGDSVLPNWGYLHLCDPEAFLMSISPDQKLPFDRTYIPYTEKPYLAVEKSDVSGVITVAYDEIKAIEYFGHPTDEYYTKYFKSFAEMAKNAVKEYSTIKQLCNQFDKTFEKEVSAYGENYRNITTLSYRQAIAAHKLIEDENGEIIFLSKECHSNGCIGTLDVTYPSIPLFLKYNPELVLGMLRPIIRFAQSETWSFPFTPHDVGRYPCANGQFYEIDIPENQMPVEECGNMLLCIAAVCKYGNGNRFFQQHQPLLKQWADYLVQFGYDPGNQLCTDDFAGHLDHNCNLSVKAILGIAAYGNLSGDNSYTDIAKSYAKKWEIDAKAKEGTRLTFDQADGWSLKYNMVWDSLLGYHLFSEAIKKEELNLYLNKLNRYGVPLDSRKDYTKIDWLMWSTCLYNNPEYFEKVTQSIMNMINETCDRVPLTDWYCTKTAAHYFFQNRTVVGGLFINLLSQF